MKLFGSSGVYIDGTRAGVSLVDKQWATGKVATVVLVGTEREVRLGI